MTDKSEAEKLADVFEALTQAEEYFDSLQDVVDGDYGVPEPNKEMRLAQLYREATAKLEAVLRARTTPPIPAENAKLAARCERNAREIAADSHDPSIVANTLQRCASILRSLTPSNSGAGLTEDEHERVENARRQMGLHRTCDTDVGNLLAIISRLTSSQVQEPSADKAALTEEITKAAAEIAHKVVDHFNSTPEEDPDEEEDTWCVVRDIAKGILISRLSAQGAGTTVQEGFKVVPAEEIHFGDFVAPIPMPTEYQKQVGEAALDHFYDGTKDADVQEACAFVFRAMLSASPSPVTTQVALRKLVDVVWNECTESTAVPSTNWADRMIARVFPQTSLPEPPAPQASNKEGE